MIINHNMASLNTYRQLSANNAQTQKSLEKLSSGLRINRAGDDAAGLAISEKMRGQIRGLDQAQRNSQDAISMIQTGEGNLNEVHSILQRMKELATQAANDTNVSVDRGEIQKEINQLSSEINRIGNTTEFNTQKILMGDGKVAVDKTGKFVDFALANGTTTMTQASQKLTFTTAATAGDTITFTLNGQQLKVTLAASGTASQAVNAAYDVTANSATVNIAATATVTDNATAIQDALSKIVLANDALKGNYNVTATTAELTVGAKAGGAFDGAAGAMAATSKSGAVVFSGGTASVGTTTLVQAAATVGMAVGSAVIGKGMTINGQTIEFYDANIAAYKGNAIGVNVAASATASDVVIALVNQANVSGVTLSQGATANDLKITAAQGGTSGNNIRVEDGGIQKQFKATFQVGANQGQSFTIDINDMRSLALGITGSADGADSATGAKFTSFNTVTNGTDSISRESALDVSNYTNATNAIKTLDNAIQKVSSERSKLGAFQNRLEHTINNLGTSSENLTAAESRIRDVDMAKEMMNFQKNNILSQAAQAMLAQANQQPQGVLQLLR